ncbi:MAG: hypothetical protein A2176_00680 [Spirochaetes bacterium RBG_13_51_14]|nr:MAG: hypothetical protein A2176_00680 [Spirochaetes bacterium RBG_13_51_14]
MKFTKSEYIIFLVAAVIIFVFATLFYFDFTSKSAVGQERVVGSITLKKRIAQRKYSSQVIWEDIERKEPVYNNDSIRTADSSQAVIRLTDGTEITVNENSMIVLSFATNEIDIQFRGGSITAARGDVGGEAVRQLNIRSGETTVSVAKSDVQVSGEQEKDISLTVNRGEAKIRSGEKEEKVKENQKVVVTKDSNQIKIYSLPLKPLSPLPDGMLVTPGNSLTVRFAWERLKPEQDGMIEVADNETFARVRVARKINGDSVSLNLPAGSYFWRLRAKNRNNGVVDMGDVRRFAIIRESPIHLVFPAPGQVFQYTNANPVINFKWTGSDMAQEYLLEISADPGMARTVRNIGTPDIQLAVDSLGEGVYYWRVVSVIRLSDQVYRSTSSNRRIDVSRKKIVIPPRPVFPPDGNTVRSAVLRDKGILFSWEKTGDIPVTRLTVSRYADFRGIVFSSTSNTNFLLVKRQLDPGVYYWRIAGMLSDNQLTEPSPAFRFSVTEAEHIKLLGPADRSEIVAEGTYGTVRFAWEKADLYGEYLVQISRSADFSQIYKDERVNTSYAVLSGFSPGTYFWRVILRKSDGSVLLQSRPNSLFIKDILAEPVILSPRNGASFEYDQLGEIDLTWKRLEDANLYRLRFYRIENNRAAFITERDIRRNAVDISDMNFLGEGKYLWSVQAFETSGDGAKVIRKSPVSKSYFVVTMNNAARKLKFITPKILYLE